MLQIIIFFPTVHQGHQAELSKFQIDLVELLGIASFIRFWLIGWLCLAYCFAKFVHLFLALPKSRFYSRFILTR